jgi:nondiscriminating aspartyl-tRNA synthetase
MGAKNMERIYVKDVKGCEDSKVLLKGWVHKIHGLGQVNFVQLRDKSGVIQLVADKEQIKDLRSESAIEVIGTKEIMIKHLMA